MPSDAGDSPAEGALKLRVDSFERSLIEEALHNSRGNQSEAARQLHVSRATLSYKMKAYGLGWSADAARSHGASRPPSDSVAARPSNSSTL